ncbi:Polycomb group RING finger protein [Trichinella pseudospiralis]
MSKPNPAEGNVAAPQPGFWPPPPSYQAATGQQYYPPPNQPSGQTFYVPVTNVTAVPVETAIVARLCPRCQIGTLSEVSNTALTIFIFLGLRKQVTKTGKIDKEKAGNSSCECPRGVVVITSA